MGQWVRTWLPIRLVLDRGGKMKFDELASILTKADSRRFPDSDDLEYALKNLIACLKKDGDEVIYDKEAKTYSKVDSRERSVATALHVDLKDEMTKFELYPCLTAKNSERCYMNVPWKLMPIIKGYSSKYDRCDFRITGEDSCRGGCGVDENIIRQYIREKEFKIFGQSL